MCRSWVTSTEQSSTSPAWSYVLVLVFLACCPHVAFFLLACSSLLVSFLACMLLCFSACILHTCLLPLARMPGIVRLLCFPSSCQPCLSVLLPLPVCPPCPYFACCALLFASCTHVSLLLLGRQELLACCAFHARARPAFCPPSLCPPVHLVHNFNFIASSLFSCSASFPNSVLSCSHNFVLAFDKKGLFSITSPFVSGLFERSKVHPLVHPQISRTPPTGSSEEPSPQI